RKFAGACLATLFLSGTGYAATTNLFVGALRQDVILEFSSTDEVIFTENTFVTISEPETMVFDSRGNLFVSNGKANSIKKITPDGQRTTFASGIAHPHRLAFGAFGFLWVTDPGAGALYAIAPSGVVFLIDSSALDPELTGLNDLAFDGAGNLFLTAGESVVEID